MAIKWENQTADVTSRRGSARRERVNGEPVETDALPRDPDAASDECFGASRCIELPGPAVVTRQDKAACAAEQEAGLIVPAHRRQPAQRR